MIVRLPGIRDLPKKVAYSLFDNLECSPVAAERWTAARED
jgi:hypothetical protein